MRAGGRVLVACSWSGVSSEWHSQCQWTSSPHLLFNLAVNSCPPYAWAGLGSSLLLLGHLEEGRGTACPGAAVPPVHTVPQAPAVPSPALILAHNFPKIHVTLQRHPVPPGKSCPHGHVLAPVKHAVPLQTCCPLRRLLSLETRAVPRCAVSFQTQGVPRMSPVPLDMCWSP